METLETLIPEAVRTALGWTLIHSFWQITLIGMVLWLTQRLTENRPAAFKYSLGIAALSLALGSALTTFWISYSHAKNNDSWLTQYHHDHSPQTGPESVGYVPADFPETISITLESWIPVLVDIWSFGAILFLIRYASSLAELRTLRRRGHREIRLAWQESLASLMGKLNLHRPVSLLESIHVSVPITYGTLKPIILIPASLVTCIPPAQLEAIVAHELAHIKRYDYVVNLLQSALEIVFFYHPVFWWINKNVREQRENACDDLAINAGISPKDLAHGLANVLNHAQETHAEMAMAFAKPHHPILNRIKRIMGFKTPHPQPTSISTITMFFTFLLGATLWVSADQPALLQHEGLADAPSLPMPDEHRFQPALGHLDIPPIAAKPNTDTLKNTSVGLAVPSLDMDTAALPDSFPPLPEMDFLMDMPKLDLGDIPIPDYKNLPSIIDIPELWEAIPVPNHDWLLQHMNNLPAYKGLGISLDSLPEMDPAFKLKQQAWLQKFEKERDEWQKEHGTKMKAWEEEYRRKMEAWQKESQPRMEEFQRKMEAWHKENEPRMKEYQLKMEAWQKEYQPRMEEFQRNMEAWQKENEPRMKEYQQKMEAWQREYQDQLNQNADAWLKGFQKKMDPNAKELP